ncbi:hypothetical protein ACLOJK_022465 [Asimina triloba]
MVTGCDRGVYKVGKDRSYLNLLRQSGPSVSPPACVVPHSWKVIQTMASYCEHRGCTVNRYLWRELLTHRLSSGYVEFLVRRDVKGIDNPPDYVPGWEARFFFARRRKRGISGASLSDGRSRCLTRFLDLA